ncbi:MAG: T9SS type A sorting domain-containing protein, partial [Chitinophagales bacterium]
ENNDYFQVLRSNDGVNFEAVGQIGGSGTTFSFNTYDFLDNSAPVGISYYQIKQVDFDGASTTSNIISLTRSKTEFGVQGVAPVPAINYVEVTFSSPSETAITATVYDVAGRVLTTLNNEANAGINALRVNTNTFSPGIYFIHILNNEQTEIVKFVKE